MRPHRIAAAAIVATLAAAVLAGCTGSPSSSEPVTLKFWSWGTGIPEIVKEFNRTHKDIKVEHTDAGGGTESSAKLVTAVRAGNAPDVSLIENTSLPRMIISGVATDITKDVADVKSDFTQGTWAQTTFDGKVYGLPQDVGPMALVYRKDVFDKYGVAAPKTWEDFRAAAATIKAQDPALTIASLSTDGWGWYAGISEQAGDSWWSYKNGTWTVNIDGEGSKQVLDFFNGMYTDGLIAADPILNPSYNQKLNDGTMLSWPSAVWAPSVIYGVAPSTAGKWALAPLPRWKADDASVSYQGGSSLAIIKGTKHAKEAAEFIKWMNADKAGVDQLINTANLYPAATAGQKAAAKQDPPKLMPQQTDYYQVVADISKDTRPVTWGPDTDVAQAAFTDAMNAAVQNGTPWRDALTATQKAVVDDMRKQGFKVKEG